MRRLLPFILMIALVFVSFAMPALADDSAGLTGVTYVPIDKNAAKVLSSSADAVKIPSNAHQDAVPGINFRWADKQKDNCVLTVDESVFDEFDSFTVLVKDASEYVSVEITEPGVYSFPKFEVKGKLHNINMVWLCDFVKHIEYHDYTVTVISNDESDISTSRYMIGNKAENVPFDTPAVETNTGSKYGSSAWLNGIAGDPNNANLIGLNPKFIWNAGPNGINDEIAKSGEVVKFEQTFNVEGTRVTDATKMYIAGDNGFLVFLNDQFIGQSGTILHDYFGEDIDDAAIATVFGDLTRTNGYVEHGNWQRIYEFNLSSALQVGENTLTIFAYNTAYDTTCTTLYDPLTNPAGIIYGFEVSSTDRP